MGRFTASVALTLLLPLGCLRAQPGLPASLRGVGFDQRLNQQVPLDDEFMDETGHAVRLRDYFHNKPVILVLGYYGCPMLCGEVLNGLVQAMLGLSFDVGKDFEVINVSIDPRERADLAAAKKETYVQRYGRPGAANGWHFLTGKENAIKRLAAAVGFRYRYDAKRDQFAHASGLMILTPAGKVSRYLFDVHYSPRDLRLALVEASEGRIGSTADQILLFCFHYDPAEGKYGPAIMNLVRLGGVLTLAGLALFLLTLWRRDRRGTRRQAIAGITAE
jgi:protein SCO1/2